MKDGKLETLPKQTMLVELENERQLEKWGVQDQDGFRWSNFLGEEYGEVCSAIAEHHFRDGSRTQVAAEAIQVATLALKIAEMYLNMGDDDAKTEV